MTDGGCAETSGFLFKHACRNDPVNTCGSCDKTICIEHSHIEDEDALCTSCVRKKVGKRGFDSRRGRRHRTTYYDDPYFYDMRYYSGYGYYDSTWGMRSYHHRHHHHHHDRDDFTEADGQSFNDPGDADFEDDMSAS